MRFQAVFDAFYLGLIGIFKWPAFGFMISGVSIGFVVGLLPGLGGMATLALMLPFVFKMEPVSAFAFLLGMYSVVCTTGDITSVLFGLPGEATTAATILDGHPMAKRGEAGRALGAALSSSLVGAIFGAFVLALAIPFVRPLVLSFGSPEFFMLAILGISFLSTLGMGSPLKGLLAGGIGLLLSTVGMDPQLGIRRYTLGLLYLADGLSVVPVVVGLFAIPEIADLAVRGTSIAGSQVNRMGGVMEGVKDTFRHWGLTLRCSAIGTLIGIIPGIGGSAQWMAYAHAVQSSADRTKFGKGTVEGVIGPGAANNSKEGGDLVPTVAFGVPGSAAMAVLLGAFTVLGLAPGRDMLTTHLHVTFSMVWVIVVSNIIAVAVSLLFLERLARLTFVRGSLLIPFIILLIFLGSFTANNSTGDLVVTLIAGILGYVMVLFDWPRPPLILGLVLGGLAENNFFVSTERYGLAWLSHPTVIVIFALALSAFLFPFFRMERFTAVGRDREISPAAGEVTSVKSTSRILFSLLVITAFAILVWGARNWPLQTRLFPWVIGISMLVLSLIQLAQDLLKGVLTLSRSVGGPVDVQINEPTDRALVRWRTLNIFSWIFVFFVGVWLLGFSVAVPLLVFLYMKVQSQERWTLSLVLSGSAWIVFWGLFDRLLHIPFPRGEIFVLARYWFVGEM
jgi:TctA family transporter